MRPRDTNMSPPDMRPPGSRLRLVLGLILVAICVVAVAAWLFGGSAGPRAAGAFSQNWPQVVILGMLLVYFAGRFLGRPGGGRALAAGLLLWGVLGLGLVAGYAMRHDLAIVARRTAAALVPGLAVGPADGSAVLIARDASGHFMIDGRADGAPVRFMIDTGASGVMLRPQDARAAGIDTAALAFTLPVRTANGTAFAAPVRLKQLALGPIVLDDVAAMVAPPQALPVSLVGLSALDRLSAYGVRGDTMELTP